MIFHMPHIQKACALAIGIASVGIAHCQTPSAAVTFVNGDPVETGWVVLHSPVGGSYVYGRSTSPDDRKMPAFFIGRLVNDRYQFFTAEEENGLRKLKEIALLDAQKAERLAKQVSDAKKGAGLSGLKWPKVVVHQDGRVCVPDLAHSESLDWKNYLLCWGQE
jgi:hypothetical protein